MTRAGRKSTVEREAELVTELIGMLTEARGQIRLLERELDAREKYQTWLAQRVVDLETSGGMRC